ncbi:MAG: BON domain-containing protein [Blastocatellia bacterium]
MTTSGTESENRSSNELFCRQCGITLRPFMKLCPRCGTRRRATAKLVLPELEPSPPERTTGSLLLPEVPASRSPSADLPVPRPLFTPDEERRFPRFTSAQWTLLVLGLLLLLVGLVIAWLLWRQQQLDERRLSLAQAAEVAEVEGQRSAPTPPPPILSPASANPAAPAGEASLDEAVVATLRAYNPFGYTRYRVGVRDGVVTLEGVAEHLPERAGAENVVRLVSGVKAVVNRLRVRSEEPSEPLLRFDRAEAALLEEAARQQRAQTAVETASPNPLNPQVNPQAAAPPAVPADPPTFERETERLRRELFLARERAQETARRQQAEDRPQPVAASPSPEGAAAEPVPRQALLRERPGVAPPPVLASGTVAWSGLVDGADEVLFTGAAATVRHLAGSPAREVRSSFSAPLPLEPVAVRLLATDGRGPITIVQQPAAENGFTTIVRVDDRQRGGTGRYQFTLRWSREAR